MTPSNSFGGVLTSFFTKRLMQQRQASAHTVSSYRDSFRMLLRFAAARTGRTPSNLTWQDIDAPLVSDYLDDLEARRGITARSRNLRLTAIRSLFKYAAFELPEHAAQIQRVLAIPSKRCARQQIGFLTLQAGVDTTVIAMWLGHESIETTHVYLEADLELKRRVLAKTEQPGSKPSIYRPDDALLALLKNL